MLNVEAPECSRTEIGEERRKRELRFGYLVQLARIVFAAADAEQEPDVGSKLDRLICCARRIGGVFQVAAIHGQKYDFCIGQVRQVVARRHYDLVAVDLLQAFGQPAHFVVHGTSLTSAVVCSAMSLPPTSTTRYQLYRFRRSPDFSRSKFR